MSGGVSGALAGAGLLLLLLLPGGPRADGAIAGAWEAFPDQTNSDAWYVYDDGNGAYYYPDWDGSVEGEEFASFTFDGDGAVSFGADENVGDGAFTGDYPEQAIVGVACEVFIGTLADLESIDCSVLADGPGGRRYYFSLPYAQHEFESDGWWSVWFGFDEPWYYWDDDHWVEVDGRTLTAIEALEITFLPLEGAGAESVVGLDNVTLEMALTPPALATGVTDDVPREFRMAFTPGPGLVSRIERLQQPSDEGAGWETVPGQTGIRGPEAHVFLTPVTAAPGIFRVASDPDYTLVWSE